MNNHETALGSGTTLQSFDYEGNPVTFQLGNGDVMVNLTQMAKTFGKETTHFLQNKQTQEFIAILDAKLGIPSLEITRGGNAPGTWAHQKLALKFAAWLNPQFELWVYDRIEELMRHGITATPQRIEEILMDPDTMIRVLTDLKEERRLRQEATRRAELAGEQLQLTEKVVKEQAPKVNYYDTVLQSNSIFAIDIVANDLGLSAMRLNKFLAEQGVIYRQQGTWVLTSKYRDMELAKMKTTTFTRSDGSQGSSQHMYWTEKGKEFIRKLYHAKVASKKSNPDSISIN